MLFLFCFMKKSECASTSDFLRSRFHDLNTIETKKEISACAQRGDALTLIRCSLDLSQLAECSLVREENRIRQHNRNVTLENV